MTRVHMAMLMLCAALPAAGRAAAIERSNLDGARTPNGRVAVGWIDGMFNKCEPKAVFDRYVDRARYHNHPAAAGGDELAMEQGIFKGTCAKGVRATIKIVVAQGDLVAALVHLSDRPEAELSEWFRIRNGRIVDHWDMSRPMKPNEHPF